MKKPAISKIVIGTGAFTVLAGVGIMGISLYSTYLDAGYTSLSKRLEQQRVEVSSLEKDVRQHWESLQISGPSAFSGMDGLQAAELYLINPASFGQANADSGLAYTVGKLLLARNEETQLRARKKEISYWRSDVMMLFSSFTVLAGTLVILAGLVVRNKEQEQARYTNG